MQVFVLPGVCAAPANIRSLYHVTSASGPLAGQLRLVYHTTDYLNSAFSDSIRRRGFFTLLYLLQTGAWNIRKLSFWTVAINRSRVGDG